MKYIPVDVVELMLITSTSLNFLNICSDSTVDVSSYCVK